MTDLLTDETLERLLRWQNEAGDEITEMIDDLHDDDLSVRTQASRRLETRGSAARPALLALVETLQFRTPRPGNDRLKLMQWNRANQGQHNAAGRALIAIGAPAVSVLAEMAASDHERATRLLAGFSEPSTVEPLLVVLAGGVPAAKIAGLESLMTIRPPGLVDACREALRDADETVALEAARALADIGDGDATRALLDGLADDDPHVREVAAELGDVSNPAATDTLVAALDSDDATVVLVAQALRNIGGTQVRMPLVSLLTHRSAGVRSAARAGLDRDESWHESDEARAGEAGLLAALESEDARLRADAADLLGLIGADEAVPALIDALRDPEPKVRGFAAASLRRLRATSAIEPLITALGSERHGFAVERISRALGELGDERAVEPLVAALDAEIEGFTSWSITAIVRALGSLGDERAIPVLVRVLNDDGFTVPQAIAAAEALGELADLGPEPVQALRAVQGGHWSDTTRGAGQIGRVVEQILLSLEPVR